MNNYLFKYMKNKILFCLTFLFLCIYSYGSPIYFCKKCKNKGFFYTYEMCDVCEGSGKVQILSSSGRYGRIGKYDRFGRCPNCSKIGCGIKSGYIRVKKSCSCSNSKCKNKKNKKFKREIDPKLKTFYKR